MIVELNATDVAVARLAGPMRYERARAKGYDPQLGDDGPEWDIKGVIGELVVAKALNVFWTDEGEPDEADVSVYRVRYISNPRGRLPVRPREHPQDDWRYVGVTGDFGDDGGELRIIGGTTGKWAMRRDLEDPGGRGQPAWFVPQHELLTVELDPSRAGYFRVCANGSETREP